MRDPIPQPVPQAQSEQEERIDGMRVGWVVAVLPDGTLRVDYPNNRLGPLTARTTLSLDTQAWSLAARERQEAVLFFDAGDPTRPVLTGLVQQPSATPLVDALLEGMATHASLEAQVDDHRVHLRGRQEVVLECGQATLKLRRESVVLECGKASLTLQRDGRAVLRGVDVVTQADGVQRIRGGKVKIN